MLSRLTAFKGVYEKWEHADYDTLMEKFIIEHAPNEHIKFNRRTFWKEKLWNSCPLCLFMELSKPPHVTDKCLKCPAFNEDICSRSLSYIEEDKSPPQHIAQGLTQDLYNAFVNEDKSLYDELHTKLLTWLQEKIDEEQKKIKED